MLNSVDDNKISFLFFFEVIEKHFKRKKKYCNFLLLYNETEQRKKSK